jgi:hypothetical protein
MMRNALFDGRVIPEMLIYSSSGGEWSRSLSGVFEGAQRGHSLLDEI